MGRALPLVELQHFCRSCLKAWFVITGTTRPDEWCAFCGAPSHRLQVEVRDAA